MKLNLKHKLAIAALAALASSGAAMAAPLLNLTVLASTTGQSGTYSSTLAAAPATGSTLYFEVVAQSAPTGTTNGTKTTNGTTDTLISLPNFAVSTGGTFATSALRNNFGTGSGASAGTTGSGTIDIRAIELGFTENTDSALVIDSGALTVGSTFSGITAATDLPVTTAGSFKPSGALTAINQASESGSNPYLSFTPVTVAVASSVPAPSVLGSSVLLAGFGALGLVARRKARLA
jgi:hypothetical protein